MFISELSKRTSCIRWTQNILESMNTISAIELMVAFCNHRGNPFYERCNTQNWRRRWIYATMCGSKKFNKWHKDVRWPRIFMKLRAFSTRNAWPITTRLSGKNPPELLMNVFERLPSLNKPLPPPPPPPFCQRRSQMDQLAEVTKKNTRCFRERSSSACSLFFASTSLLTSSAAETVSSLCDDSNSSTRLSNWNFWWELHILQRDIQGISCWMQYNKKEWRSKLLKNCVIKFHDFRLMFHEDQSISFRIAANN